MQDKQKTFLGLFCVLMLLPACVGDPTLPTSRSGTGGTRSASTVSATSRGAAGTGGSSAKGGSSATSDTSASGGSSADPESTSTGGQAAGGSVGSGGSASTGSANPTGGSSNSGDSSAGGSTARGGTTAAGGSTGDAGRPVDMRGALTDAAVSPDGSGSTGGSSAYHKITNWKTALQHGRLYFLANSQKDERGKACTTCHGSNYEGDSGPECASCHSDWRSCTFCHGTLPSQTSPPKGVNDETMTNTLAVGRHVAHLSAGIGHTAFACTTCHKIPPTDDIAHTIGYQPSNDLSTTGKHGDVLFSGLGSGTTWNVAATTGSPVTARGTCTGACHSNGRGGSPAKTPYWAGGTWTKGCTNCHGATGTTGGEHGHGFPGSTCADCHTGATATSYTAATHMNGKRDFRTSPGGKGAGMRLTASFGCSNVSSSCHGGD
jgi:predicted CxxxxCH...CXXCH cytochrome family protein